MVGTRAVTLVVVGALAATVLASGPLVPVDLTTADGTCEGGALAAGGSATVERATVADSAALTRSSFGADVYRLEVPAAEVTATDVRGCVRFTYEIRVAGLGVRSFSVATVSADSNGEARISIPKSSFAPDRITEDEYAAEVRLIYRGTENGAAVERTVASRNVTVEVDR
ncbi:hypothetical protein [Halostella litorea]|uniref:hypothetical protein n=1 Tax=Halostella litorea TaxID=2528831 RepID=UPI001091A7CC|nr:hypothetical protein [Halostella litorea]